jgi:lysophospholipase L1-like esterase
MGTRGRGAVIVIVVVVLAVVAVVTARAFHRGPEVVLVGDSITFQTIGVFEEELGDDWGLTIHGVPSMRADQLLPAVPELAAHHPVQVVVNLGTNDALQGTPPGDTVAALEQLAAGFPGARCIHLVTINEHMLTPEGVAAGLNARIRDLAARRGWHTVPWDAVVRDYDAGPQPEGPVTSDSVHPTAVGERLLADAYDRALAACPR